MILKVVVACTLLLVLLKAFFAVTCSGGDFFMRLDISGRGGGGCGWVMCLLLEGGWLFLHYKGNLFVEMIEEI